MKPTTHILVPTDLSSASMDAIGYAAALAGPVGARLHLVHVLEDPHGKSGPYAFSVPDRPDRHEQLYQHARTALSRAAAKYRDDLIVTVEVREGPVTEAILNAAVDYGADLIVMGTQGRGGLKDLLVGSTTDQVNRLARCPVLAVRQPRDTGRAAA